MTYADQATGLGPDEMLMEHWVGGSDAGSWVNHVKEWDKAGRPGDIPPGLREMPTEPAGSRDYSPRKTSYLLRPEVGVMVT